MAFADVAANLRLNISDFSSKLAIASRQMGSFAKTMNKQYGDASKALTKHNFDLKDTARIVQGIVVAQAFYTGARAIREATSALWDFNRSLDYAHVTYSALFGDTQLASNFMSVLKEHSIETIFDYQNLADASKKLLAYGIEYENLMFIMEGLTNLGAMSGDTAALDRISLALGQIYTRGKLTAEEMRQLANAYVPISDIIKEKFNLTPDEMGKVGNLNLPAGEVINAIVDYANERFASVGDAAMYTITGLQNKIVDTLKVIGVEMLGPLTTAYKSFLAYISDGLEAIREEFGARGVGGIFEYLVPDPNTQQMLRQFIANVRNLFMSIASIGVVMGQVFGNFAHMLVSAFNIVIPVITMFINVLSAALNAMLSNRVGAAALRIALLGAAAAFVVLRVHALGALVITAVTKAVMGLSKALIILATLVTRHPILSLLAGLAIALVGISTASGNANSGLNKLFDTISGASGVSSGDVLQGVNKDIVDGSDALNDFNNRFEEGAGAADDLANGIGDVGKAADKAKKKAGLLSFDEVFKLNDPSSSSAASGAGAGIGDAIENLAAGLGSLGDALIPEIPDFSDFTDAFSDGLFGGLKDSLIAKLSAFGIGAWLADKLFKALKLVPLTGAAVVARNIAAALLRAISGAFVGLAFDSVASILTSKLWQALEDRFRLSAEASENASLGATIGSAIGSAIGIVAGGIPGSLIGAAIGHLVGGIVGLFWEKLKVALAKPDTALGASIGASIGAFLGPIGAAVGALVGGIIGNFWQDISAGFDVWWAEFSAAWLAGWAMIGETFSGWFAEFFNAILTGWAAITEFFSSWWLTFSEAWRAGWTAVAEQLTIMCQRMLSGITTWLSNVATAWTTRYNSIKTTLATWWNGLIVDFTTWQQTIAVNLSNWLTDTVSSWLAKYDEVKTGLTIWWQGLTSDYIAGFAELLTTTVGKLSDIKTKWSEKWAEVRSDFGDWWKGLKTDMGRWLEDYVWKPIADFFNVDNFWNRIKGMLDAIKDRVSSWWSSLTSIFSSSSGGGISISTRSSGSAGLAGHARGGIFNREHIARFAENDKAEAIIPLENASAMQPFVNAISDGILQGLMPVMASSGSNNNLPPMYVGTLIADDRGLKQLYKKFEVIEAQEAARKGFA